MSYANSDDRRPNRSGVVAARGKDLGQRATMKKLIRVRSADNEGWACSDCAWVFNPSGPPLGVSLDEMKENFRLQRDKEFASHVCAQHPRAKSRDAAAGKTKDVPKFPRKPEDQM
jgi:hypothetical protein